MYYDLKKDEYMEYEKKFKSTYVGKQLFQARMIAMIIGCILWGLAGWIIGYYSVEELTVTLPEFTLLFVGGICLLASVLWHIQYRKEIKKYIIEKNK